MVTREPDRVGRCCMLDRDPASLIPEPILAGGLSSCKETGVEVLRPEPRCGGIWSPRLGAPVEDLVWMSTSCLRPSSSSVPSRKGWYCRGSHRSRVVYPKNAKAATRATAKAAAAPRAQSGQGEVAYLDRLAVQVSCDAKPLCCDASLMYDSHSGACKLDLSCRCNGS